jgi:hypothetical protein
LGKSFLSLKQNSTENDAAEWLFALLPLAVNSMYKIRDGAAMDTWQPGGDTPKKEKPTH